ncbi:hypothetical protein [Tsukamurella paurometabola]|uniref:Uncharacterized protein n=1 Tax=Tsukamurella paurometabola TaxID=2061 RepID=A0ABS5N6U3_TSUPA|nr:hypothetical protein [Tsukamurella paurometabola]MBS4099976.1 hypothetical protein [Tsukamurella paurometabola]
MPRLGDSETRTVPVAVLKAFAGLLLLLWLTLGAAFVLVDWPVDGPRGQSVARGLMFAASLVVAITAAQLWRIAVGSDPAMSARDARGLVGGFVLIIPAMTRWSIGTPQGTVQRVSYGPDPMRSLTAALADAEATVAVI